MIAIALLLTSTHPIQSDTGGDYKAAYEKALRSSFRSRSIEQCRALAKNAAAAKIDATSICACVTDRLLATRSVDDLKTPIPRTEVQTLSTECIAAILPTMTSNP